MNDESIETSATLTHSATPFEGWFADRVLWACVVVAVLLHAGLIFAVSFVAGRGDQAKMQEVSVAVHLSQQADPEADFLAQNNQQGSGVLRNTYKLTSPERSENSSEVMQQIAQPANLQRASEAQTAADHRVLTTTLSWRKQAQSTDKKTKQERQESPSAEAALAAQAASLEAQYAKRKQDYSKKTNVRTIDSISAKADPSAGYLERFRQRVEQAGNRHYPDAARAQGLNGDVRLMVSLTPDGSIRAIKVLASSRHRVLDEAAKASVRYGAPYGKFEAGMKDYSELRIIRTWRFSEHADQVDVEQ